jgi:feruloyl esterase
MRMGRAALFGAVLLIFMAGLDASAVAAAPRCSVAALSGFGVAHVAVASAIGVAAGKFSPPYCAVEGTVATQGEGAGPGSAEFVLKLPAAWNRRLVFFGCGGNCGSVKSVSANPDDVAAALGLGYAAVNTDAGHEQDPSTPDPTWILLKPGAPNEPAIADFFYRAVHQVATAAKRLAEDYYSGRIDHAYFDGCSTGGRQSLIEGERYPDDFDGLIAGDPIIDLDDQRAATIKQAKAFLPPTAYIPFRLIPAIDAAVNASCDAADGVADGLIQNPALCAFDPHALAPATLTRAQADALAVYLKAVVDDRGRPVAPGMTVGDYAASGFERQAELSAPVADPAAAEPWGGVGAGPSAWTLGDAGIRYFILRDPTFDVNNDWPEHGDVVAAGAVALLRRRSWAGDADDPRRLSEFLRQDRKIILYHGFSDDMASPYRTIWFYKALARGAHGFSRLQSHARLFMVPGMGHCGGGSGPHSFATLTALDAWVTNGVAPDAIRATATGGGRTMPLCKFPEEARRLGGPVDAARSWTCRADDRRLLEIGPDGALAGADADYQPGPAPGGG